MTEDVSSIVEEEKSVSEDTQNSIDEALSVGLPSLIKWIKEQQDKIASAKNGEGETFEIEQPKVFISKVSNKGKIFIRFSKQIMFSQQMMDSINNRVDKEEEKPKNE